MFILNTEFVYFFKFILKQAKLIAQLTITPFFSLTQPHPVNPDLNNWMLSGFKTEANLLSQADKFK